MKKHSHKTEEETCYIGIMENENGNPLKGRYRGYIGVILGLYRDNGKEHGNYYNGVI